MLQQTKTNETYIISTQNFKIQYGGRTPYYKNTIISIQYNSTSICPICTKFCTKMQHSTTLALWL